MNIVEAVQKGMNGKYIFHDPSFSEPIEYRPITRYEHEQCRIDSMEGCSRPVMEYISTQLSLTKHEKLDLTDPQVIEYAGYMFKLMVNIVYHGTKDFQPETYNTDYIEESFIDVKGLAQEILEKSVRPKEEVIQLINTPEGENLLAIHFVLNVPLASEAWKLTPLQCTFLNHGYRVRSNVKSTPGTVSQEDLDKDPEKFKEYIKSLFNV